MDQLFNVRFVNDSGETLSTIYTKCGI
jgi:hypothetical protein